MFANWKTFEPTSLHLRETKSVNGGGKAGSILINRIRWMFGTNCQDGVWLWLRKCTDCDIERSMTHDSGCTAGPGRDVRGIRKLPPWKYCHLTLYLQTKGSETTLLIMLAKLGSSYKFLTSTSCSCVTMSLAKRKGSSRSVGEAKHRLPRSLLKLSPMPITCRN